MRLLIALVPLSLVGCGGLDCTEMYAPSGVTIGFEAADWPAGDYEVEVQGKVCTVTLPDTDGSADCDYESTPTLELFLSADGSEIESAWYYEDAPASLDVRVSRDGSVIFEETVSPQYTVDEPNGKGCGERTSASVTLSLD